MREKASPCGVCHKPTLGECSHVDCPNRRPVTACAVGSPARTSGEGGDGRTVSGSAIVRRPHLFVD